MDYNKEKTGMLTTELQELMDLQTWSRTHLAAELDITANAVDKWFKAGQVPGGPASILLRDWLARARQGLPLRADSVNGVNGTARKRKAVAS